MKQRTDTPPRTSPGVLMGLAALVVASVLLGFALGMARPRAVELTGDATTSTPP